MSAISKRRRGHLRRLGLERVEDRFLLSAAMPVDVQTLSTDALLNSSALQASATAGNNAVVLSDGMVEAYVHVAGSSLVTGSLGGRDESFSTIQLNSFNLLPSPPVLRLTAATNEVSEIRAGLPTASEQGAPAAQLESAGQFRIGEGSLQPRTQTGQLDTGRFSIAVDTALRSRATDAKALGLTEPEAQRIAVDTCDRGMIDITPDPQLPPIILALDPPPEARPTILATTARFERAAADPAQPIVRPVLDRPVDTPETPREASRAEGIQGRQQSFDLAWVMPLSSSPAVAAADAAVATLAAPVVPAVAHEAEAPTPCALPRFTALPALEKAVAAAPACTASVAVRAAAVAEVSDWLSEEPLPRLAVVDVRRTAETVPLLVLAAIGHHYWQAHRPDPAGPTTLEPPRRRRPPRSGDDHPTPKSA